MDKFLIFTSLVIVCVAGYEELISKDLPYEEKLANLLGDLPSEELSEDFSERNASGSAIKPDPCALPVAPSFKNPGLGPLPILNFEDLWKVTEAFIKNKVILGNSQIALRNAIRWRREIVQLHMEIFRKSVSTEFVPNEIHYVARELVLGHFDGIKGSDAMQNKEVWDQVIPQLKACRDSLTQMKLVPSSASMQDVAFMNSAGIENMIFIPEETADSIRNLDLSIETLWNLFSFSLGACYPLVDVSDRIIWASNYFQAFKQDFISVIAHKWVSGFSQLQQSIMFGDFDVLKPMKNIRLAVGAVYTENGIPDRQLNRPMYGDKDGYNLNEKTGAFL